MKIRDALNLFEKLDMEIREGRDTIAKFRFGLWTNGLCYPYFETVSTAIPLFPNIPPYTQIPTQYSIHFCQQLGQISEHRDFLSDGKVDPREELARHLIDNLEGVKSIVVYSNFERKIIQSLAEHLPNRKEAFDKIINKFVDLETIIKKHFYHPGFRGIAK